MCALEWLPRFVVIKAESSVPVVGFVTANACRRCELWTELVFVWSRMAFVAEFLIDRRPLVDLLAVFCVAIQTFDFRMCAIERKTSFGVIELSAFLIEPTVRRMALGAFFSE